MNSSHTKYYGIFSELNQINAAICIQNYWRTCRYNPEYRMCERVVTNNIKTLAAEDRRRINIIDDSYNQAILKRKQTKIRSEVENTRMFLDSYFKLQATLKQRTILKPRRLKRITTTSTSTLPST